MNDILFVEHGHTQEVLCYHSRRELCLLGKTTMLIIVKNFSNFFLTKRNNVLLPHLISMLSSGLSDIHSVRVDGTMVSLIAYADSVTK